MPKLIHATPCYRRHRASGQAIVTLNGHDHYLGPYGSKSSRVKYDPLIGEWLAAGRRLPLAASDLMVAELAVTLPCLPQIVAQRLARIVYQRRDAAAAR